MQTFLVCPDFQNLGPPIMFTYFHSNQKIKAAGVPSGFYAAQKQAPSLLALLADAFKLPAQTSKTVADTDAAYHWGL